MAENENKIFDYGAVLADLQAKRAALDQAIISLQAAAASGALIAGPGEAASALNGLASLGTYGGDVPVGAFLGKSIPDAAKLCLQIVRRKMTTREIADALKKGGIDSTAKTSFSAIVHSVLTRASKSDVGIVKFDRSHWGLAEWMPRGLRTGQGKVGAARRRKPKSTKSGVSSERKPVADAMAKLDAEGSGHHPGKLSERAVEFLKAHPSEEFTAKQLSEQFGIHSKVISMTLAKPVKDGKIMMSAPSTYTAAKSAP